MKIQGTFIKQLPIQEGVSANGQWQRSGFVIQYGDEYTHNLAFSTFGDKVHLTANIQQGQRVEVSFSVESREYNDKFYTECKCFAIQVIN